MKLKVRPIHAVNGRIQGWAVEHNNVELSFAMSHTNAMNYANWWWRKLHDDV